MKHDLIPAAERPIGGADRIRRPRHKKVSKRDVDAIREQLSKMALQVKRTDTLDQESLAFFIG